VRVLNTAHYSVRAVHFQKRILLNFVCTVIILPELYMLTDRSKGCRDTWDFLDRRIEDSASLSTLPAEVHSIYINY